MSEWIRNKNILITGISGFLGSNLAYKLQSLGANVTGILRDQVSFFKYGNFNIIQGQIENLDLLKRVINEYEIEICFHLAAQAIVSIWDNNPVEIFESNIKGTWNVLEACRLGNKIKAVIIASSDKAYGAQEKLPYKEDCMLNGTHPYEVSKICTEFLVKSYNSNYGMPTGITRCANLYGPGDRNFSRIIPGTIRSILRGEEPVIRGNGENMRDYIYIDDATDGYVDFAQKVFEGELSGEVINLGTGQPFNVREVVEKIIRLSSTDTNYKIIGNELSKEIMHQYVDNEKAGKLLGWFPRYSLDEGLKRSIDWYASEYSFG